MLSEVLIRLWLFFYGKLRLRGSGALIRLFYPVLPGLKRYPLEIPGVGTSYLDFGTGMGYSMLLRFKLNDLGTDVGLYREMEKYLHPGAVLWDVGAYVGYITAHFAHPRFQLSSIHAFEPNPRSLGYLQQLYKGHQKVRIHPYALGNKEEVMTLSVPTRGASTASLVDHAEGKPVQVQVKLGDHLREEEKISPPDVIKIDVEGFEPAVIQGLAETIADSRPTIFFEHIFLNLDQIKAMVPQGYKLLFIQDDGQITEDASGREKGHDAILVPKEKLGKTKAGA